MNVEDEQALETIRRRWRDYLPPGAQVPSHRKPLNVSNEQWRERLPADRYRILFDDGTEISGSSPLLEIAEPGVFLCAACGLPLFTTPMKFDSGTGWPSFFTCIPDTLEMRGDASMIWPRTEYHCVRCGGHQGHLFDDGPPPTGTRYCNNGLALEFLPSGGTAST